MKADGINSIFYPVKTGVPQGSIIGPLLFLIYINDLPLQTSSEIDMYADDSTIHKSGKNLLDIQTQLQSDLKIVQNWCFNNNMAINPSKTTCMVIGSKGNNNNLGQLTLKIEGNSITNVHVQKLLGVYIDQHLTWSTHIDKTCSKIVSKLYLLKKNTIFPYPSNETNVLSWIHSPYF